MCPLFPWKSAALLLILPAVWWAGLAGAQQPGLLPELLQPPKGNVLLLELRAEGVLVYECKPKNSEATEFEWVSKGPETELFDDRGEKAGTHTSGPTWIAKDGSKVVGAKKATYPAPSGRAIAWLLLEAKSHEGTGIFSKVSYIQRIDTWAGQPPGGIPTKESAGKLVRVRYEATYRFFVPEPGK